MYLLYNSICLLVLLQCSSAQFNLTLYKKIPAMYQLEDYDLCMQQPPSQMLAHSTYCLVYAEIVPNATSTLWQQIQMFSKDEKRNFRHDHLLLGVCLEHCKRALSTLSKFQVQMLYGGKVLDKELSLYFAKVHKRSTDERLHYDHLINRCLNRQYTREYQLRLRSSIVYCERSNESLPHDSLDKTAYVLLGLLLLVIIVSSFYDYRLKGQEVNQNNTFYQGNLTIRSQRLYTAFSICRNYYRIIKPHTSEFAQDLRFFDAFRVIGVFIVILGHTLMIFMAIQNGNVVIQIFFVMSGFLLYTNFTQRQLVTPNTTIGSCIRVYFYVFFHRYLRLLPSLCVLILFNATFLARLQDGPLWRHISEPERVFCRENWWMNIFFVNNYMLKESCAQQTWYMGADMQLFELFLIIAVTTKKYPHLTKPINIILLNIIWSVPMLLTYLLKLDAVYHLKPETYRNLFFRESERTFYQIYTPFYTNIGGYLFGFICANLYLKARLSTKLYIYQGKLKYKLAVWLLISAALMVLFSGYIFMKYDFQKPTIWLAVYAGIYKNLWILICAGFVCCMYLKLGGVCYEFCTLPVFRPLSRISFQAFLWHIVVLRFVAGYFREPVYINRFFMVGNVIFAFVLTQIIAFIVALLIEYPLAEVTRLLIRHNNYSIKPASTNSLELPRIQIK